MVVSLAVIFSVQEDNPDSVCYQPHFAALHVAHYPLVVSPYLISTGSKVFVYLSIIACPRERFD